MDFLLCAEDSEPQLLCELDLLAQRVEPVPRWPGVVEVRELEPRLDPIFALDVLRDATVCAGESIGALADAAFQSIAEPLDRHDTGFALHVSSAQPDAELDRRASLLGLRIRELLKQKRRRTAKREVEQTGRGVHIVQVVLAAREHALVAIRTIGAGEPRAWPAGRAPIEELPEAPSRAYRKLLEAWAWMGESPTPGEHCVDLGGSPGGWAYAELQRGAFVFAIDRAPVEERLLGHPRLKSQCGDAFGYEPSAPVDWLTCDVICTPDRTAELVDRWWKGRLCSKLVATLKLKGLPDQATFAMIETLRHSLLDAGATFVCVKHLVQNGNEITVMAKRQG